VFLFTDKENELGLMLNLRSAGKQNNLKGNKFKKKMKIHNFYQ
jgi:hypothetical protein